MDEVHWKSSRSADGVAAVIGRGRVLLGIAMALLALVAYLGGRPAVGSSPVDAQIVPPASRQTSDRAFSRGTSLPTNSRLATQMAGSGPRLRRSVIDSRHWQDTVAKFPSLVQGAVLVRVREVGEKLGAALPVGLRGRPSFQIDIVDSPIEHEYAFSDGRLLLTSGLASKLQTPGQVAAVLSQMMERVVAETNASYVSTPWAQMAIALSANAGFDPRALAWLLDQKTQAVPAGSPNSRDRIRTLQLQSERVAQEIAAAFPSGVPDTLIK